MIKKYIFLIMICVSFFPYFSCVNLDTEADYLADAFIVSKIIDGDTLYSIEGYVSSNTTMKSVTMKSPDGGHSIDLEKSDYYGYYFERPLKNENLAAQKPVIGNYLFEIVYEDETAITGTDNVTNEIIEPIEIKEVKPDSVNNSIIVSWLKNMKSDYYAISIFRNDSIVYYSNEINPATSSVEIYAYTSKWSPNIDPNHGDTLQIVLSGILYENSNYQYPEFQSISFSQKNNVVWPD